jgi:pyoverdine/dityrosine biosynthesis protein Dit1
MGLKEKMPVAIKHIGRYDVWDHSDPDSLKFHYGMMSRENMDPNSKEFKDFWTRLIVEQDVQLAMQASSRVVCLQEGLVSLEGKSSELSRDQISKAYFGI